ncbi:hypothetical protein HC031_20800 [Planosporangium thailandense]|uniref:Integral membrane protein n=1 Tax=Planosporangium thailandense TaxID=765197 RepID=A0ABX0Y1A4_9ACTN|nr:hypothetical protein [Planosporangium thailandense]NJC72136.1 hypothetical protein [Planosporangium thailandense]
MRTVILLLAATATVVEALVVGGVLYVLGVVIGDYSMSMGGLPATGGQVALWILAVALTALLAAPAVPLVRAAVRHRPLGRRARALIVGALALQAVLGLVVGLASSELAVLAVLAVFSLLLSTLVVAAAPAGADRRPAGPATAG